MRRILLLALAMAALSGCTLSFGGSAEEELVVFSGVPQVRISSPMQNATYLSDVTVNVQIQVANAGTDIDRVEVFLDDSLIGTLPQPNPASAAAFGVTQTFTPVGAGPRVIKAIAYRADGTASEPALVTIDVIDQLPQRATATFTATVQPTATLTPVVQASPTTAAVQPTVTSQVIQPTANTVTISTSAPQATSATAPVARFEGGVNIRSGPSANFEPPIGTFQAGQQATILALNTDGTWLKVQVGAGTGWVYASLVKTEGDLNALPREAGPPIPTARPTVAQPVQPPAQSTSATQLTNTPAPASDGANLVIVGWEMYTVDAGRPANDIVSGRQSIAFVRIRNIGNQATNTGFFAVLTIVNTGDSGAKVVEAASTGVLGAGEEVLLQIGFTDTTAAGTSRTAVVRADENGQVIETNENDNASSPIVYTLAAP